MPETEPPAIDAAPKLPVRRRERSFASAAWYRFVQEFSNAGLLLRGGLKASGTENIPAEGGALLVSNHASYLDVFALGIPLHRPLNYVARSTLFVPVLGPLIRSVGGFPIEREGVGKQGLLETLRRVKEGGIVALFPEGTRTPDGTLQPLKPGIAVLVNRANAPVIPAGVAGSFEAWPKGQKWPKSYPLRVHFGEPIRPEELAGLDRAAVTALIAERIAACMEVARAALPPSRGAAEH